MNPQLTEPDSDELNPAEKLSARETAAWDQISAGLRDDGVGQNTTSDADDASAALNDQEQITGAEQQGLYDRSEPSSGGKKTPLTIKGLLKKRGGILSIVSILGAGGGILGGFFGGSTMLINLVENLIDTNDSASVVKETRFKKVFRNLVSNDSDELCKKSSKIKCKMGKISNKGLKRLAKHGIVAVDADGKPIDIKNRGYPDRNPSHYSIDGGKPVKASDLVDELLKKGNEKQANKVFGRTGAFNMRVRAWTGKHIKGKFFDVFGIKRNGGITKLIDKKLGIKERIDAFKKKLPKPNPTKASEKIRTKINNSTKSAKRGGMAYLVASSACILVKVPTMFAVGAAAVQLAPLLKTVSDIVLSPGHQNKAAGFDSGFTQEDIETIGTMLTERGTTEGSKNTEGSALDSAILLTALGVNKNKAPLSSFVPGYSIITEPFFQDMKKAEDVSESYCNVILSPITMYSFMAAEMVMAASTGGVSALVSFIGKEVASEIATSIADNLISGAAEELLKKLLSNDALATARYKDLGDALGVGAAAFFSSGGMAQMLPTLKLSQLAEFNSVQLANEEFHKKLDIASLSPFDTSSKYTFLGSITHNMGNMMLSSGTYDGSLSSIFNNIIRLPSMALSFGSTVSASGSYRGVYGNSENYCGFADDYGYTADGDNVAINLAALPCVGYSSDISTEEAISIAEKNDWIDDSKDISESASIDELMGNYFKEDTPLYDYISTCSDASTGEYWTNATGCTVPTTDSSPSSGGSSYKSDSFSYTNGEGVEDSYSAADAEIEGGDQAEMVDNATLAAMPALLIDYQIAQSINGEDEEPASDGGTESGDMTLGTPDNVEPYGKGWTLKKGVDYSGVECSAGTTDAGVKDVLVEDTFSKIRLCNVQMGSSTAQVASLISANVTSMLEAAASAGITLKTTSSFRSYEEQNGLFQKHCGGVKSNCVIDVAVPGLSQHERGLALDLGLEGGSAFCYPARTCEGNAGYDWMMANGPKFGFYKNDTEAWHFSMSGQ